MEISRGDTVAATWIFRGDKSRRPTWTFCRGWCAPHRYQVLGHAKTICVLVVGYIFFGGVITGQQFLGMCMAVGGMMAYSRASQAAAPAPAPSKEESESLDDLLKKNKGAAAV